MAKTKISEFSSTPGNNTDIDSINISEGCAPSGINDAIRELMAQLKDFQTGAAGDSFNGPVGTTTAAAGAFTTLTTSSTVTHNGGTANGVAYLNGSKVLTTGSALTFDGSTLNVTRPSTEGLVLELDSAGASTRTLEISSFTNSVAGAGWRFNASSSAGVLAFSTNSTEGMRLTSTGLGIGTSSPVGKLHVNTGANSFNAVTIAAASATGNTWGLGIGSGADLTFYQNGATAERMRIDSAGNVGIGTSSPTVRLQVSSATASQIYATDTTSGNTAQMFASSAGAVFGSFTNADVQIRTNNTERLRITAAGNVGIGTSSPSGLLHLAGNTAATTAPSIVLQDTGTTATRLGSLTNDNGDLVLAMTASLTDLRSAITLFDDRNISFTTNATERARIDSSGNLLVGKTTSASTTVGTTIVSDGRVAATVGTAQIYALLANRQNDDGVLVSLRQADTQEGTISVSGTTVSYNGGHLSRWAQTTTPKNDTLVKGTVLSNLDEMNVYVDAEGNPVENEQLNKVKVSDVEGDANVAGVFVNWTYDDAHNVDEINMAMTGDMIIRIAQGTTVQRGDLLMSAGDGTAKPQGDDIVRSKTVAKVTSTHVTCTYADGSFCVPCVLMAC